MCDEEWEGGRRGEMWSRGCKRVATEPFLITEMCWSGEKKSSEWLGTGTTTLRPGGGLLDGREGGSLALVWKRGYHRAATDPFRIKDD
eukprot:scaffold154841_cov33-Tisochrysis_lutea.AAC.4